MYINKNEEWKYMRPWGLIIVILGILYLIYSILFRKQVTIYNKNDKMIINNMDSYLKLQLFFSVITSLYIIITGIITIITNVNISYVVLSVIFFHLINCLFKIISKKRGDISYN